MSGTAISTVVTDDGEQTVSSGGVAVHTELNGGNQLVDPGGVASFTTVSNGFQAVTSGGAASSTVVGDGGVEYVSGGSANLTTAASGGVVLVDGGGTATGLLVNSGGLAFVYSGSVADSTTVDMGGTLVVVPGALVTIENPAGGGNIITGGVIVLSGVAILSGPVPSITSAIISGSALSDLVLPGGSAISSTVEDDGSENVYSGGIAADAQVSNNGSQSVFSGGSAAFTVLSDGGRQNVYRGGVAVGALLTGGDQYVYGGGTAAQSVLSDGDQYVSSGGLALSAVLTGGVDGVQYVYSGGSAGFSVVEFESTQVVLSSGLAFSAFLDNGAQEVVSGGLAEFTIISGGEQRVDAGGLSVSAMVSYGGFEAVAGTANYTTVSSGGFEYVSAGGVSSDSILDDGGYEYLSHGTAYVTTVGGSGFEVVAGGGVADQTVVDSGGTEVIHTASGLASGTLVDNGGAIDLRFLPFNSGGSAVVSGNDMLVVTEGTGRYQQQLSGDYTGLSFQPSLDAGTGTLLTLTPMPCFAEGTRIRTTDGEVAVEALVPGDIVLTHEGTPRSIRWVGRRRIDLTRHANAARVRPIRIVSDAVAENMPHRDLVVSPDHALFVDGVLIPARLLVNGASITVEAACRTVAYYHVELDSHDILLAEGLPVESYLDTGDRAMFENGGAPLRLHPDFSARRWEGLGCAKLVFIGPELDAARQTVDARAAAPKRRDTRRMTSRGPRVPRRINTGLIAPST